MDEKQVIDDQENGAAVNAAPSEEPFAPAVSPEEAVALREQAAAANGESVLVTFDPHPKKIVHPAESLQLINTLDEKIELLDGEGAGPFGNSSFHKRILQSFSR